MIGYRFRALALSFALASPVTFSVVAIPGDGGGLAGNSEERSRASIPSDVPQEPLGVSIAGLIGRSAFSQATWGIEVRTADRRTLLFETNSQKLLKPASTAKLFTAALALDRLGPRFTIQTDLVAVGSPRYSGALAGDLIVFGRGDPSFAGRFHDGDAGKSLDRLVEALVRAGVRRIDGALVGDDSYFEGPPFGTGWTWDDLQYYYGAEVSALSVDENVVDLVLRPGNAAGDPVRFETKPATPYLDFQLDRLVTGPRDGPGQVRIQRMQGSRVVTVAGTLPAGGELWTDAVTVSEPTRYFLTRLEERLAHRGIRVRDGIRVEHGARQRRIENGGLPVPSPRSRPATPRPTVPPLVVRSPPVAELLPRMLKPSQNLAAQLLLLQVGALETPDVAMRTTEEAGLAALRRFLVGAGISPESVLLDEGSGLSRSCLVTPAALVGLLLHMDRHRDRDAFLDALPVAGGEGTLRRRLRDTAAAGNLRAKTGSLRYVDTLAGFVTNAAGHRLVFAVMLNAYRAPADGPTGREAIDAVAERIAASTDP